MKRTLSAKNLRARIFSRSVVVGLMLVNLVPFTARSVTVADFGHRSMRINGTLPIGSRPLLVIVANYDGTPALTNRDWDSLIFTGTNSLAGYYNEISNGRFTWTNAGLFLVNFTQPERMTITTHFQILNEAVYRVGIDFANFDANQDGTVTGDELSILIIENRNDGGGQARFVQGAVFSPSSPPFFLIDLALRACQVAHKDSFMTYCHETCHTLGGIDLYGYNSSGNNIEDLHNGISLFCATIATNSNMQSFHLDPWHKLRLGWCDPRIVSLRGNGRAIIPAAQLGRADAPVLLFDPLRGNEEFYLLEYRTNNTSAGQPGFDVNVRQQGLLIWHIRQSNTLDHATVKGAPHTTLPFPTQTGWTICSNCMGNFYRLGQSSSHCSAGGTHKPFDTHDFSMVWGSPADPGQQNWLWCRKCQSLFFGGNSLPTRCPADNGSHDGSQSANYVLRFQSQKGNLGQRGWLWCNKCQALFYAGFDSNNNPLTLGGVCPVSGQHDGQGSGEYNLHYDLDEVFNEAASVNGLTNVLGVTTLGVTRAWRIGDTTPYSRWFSDGTEVRVRFRPTAYLNGGDELQVDWISELSPPPFTGETWVDYSAPPIFGNGTFFNPFNSLRQAVDAAPFYRKILFKPGSGAESIRITQSVFLAAPLGPVTIGRRL